MKALLQSPGLELRGMAHITGGGLPENLPRALPQGLAAQIDPGSWERPALFRWLQELGSVPERDLWHTFNLGVGYVLVLPESSCQQALEVVHNSGFTGWICGEIVAVRGFSATGRGLKRAAARQGWQDGPQREKQSSLLRAF